jgi:hypothetical protein
MLPKGRGTPGLATLFKTVTVFENNRYVTVMTFKKTVYVEDVAQGSRNPRFSSYLVQNNDHFLKEEEDHCATV